MIRERKKQETQKQEAISCEKEKGKAWVCRGVGFNVVIKGLVRGANLSAEARRARRRIIF